MAEGSAGWGGGLAEDTGPPRLRRPPRLLPGEEWKTLLHSTGYGIGFFVLFLSLPKGVQKLRAD